ncbi:MAG TPA: RNA methyltransferase [Terriglobales bacterium]|nr:RNA methyltransferase [Terriglobales bacterium]
MSQPRPSARARHDKPERLRRVEGRHNSLVKELRSAFARAELTEAGDCAIEGLRIVEAAIRSGLKLHAVFFSESAETRAERLLPQLGAHVETVVLPDKLFGSAVPSETPQGVAALVRYRQHSLEDVLGRIQAGPVVAVAGLQDPGNLGTILRSAEAFGAVGALLGEGTVSPFNPKVVRGSAGSIFRLPVVRVKLGEALALLRECQARLVATSSHKGTQLREANLSGPIAILIGGEGSGVPRDLLAKMDEIVAIPHAPQVESLNAGVAASIVLYEMARQRANG